MMDSFKRWLREDLKWLALAAVCLWVYIWLYHHGYVSLPPDDQPDYFTG
jgi:hypothetical protein